MSVVEIADDIDSSVGFATNAESGSLEILVATGWKHSMAVSFHINVSLGLTSSCGSNGEG
jgi:hypothetical protein